MKVQLALSKEQHPEKSHAIRFKEIAKVSFVERALQLELSFSVVASSRSLVC